MRYTMSEWYIEAEKSCTDNGMAYCAAYWLHRSSVVQSIRALHAFLLCTHCAVYVTHSLLKYSTSCIRWQPLYRVHTHCSQELLRNGSVTMRFTVPVWAPGSGGKGCADASGVASATAEAIASASASAFSSAANGCSQAVSAASSSDVKSAVASAISSSAASACSSGELCYLLPK